MATLSDFKRQVADEVGKDFNDPEVIAEAQVRYANYIASLPITTRGK